MKEEFLTPPEDFEVESYEEFTNRYSGFGKELYMKLKDKIPHIFHALTFHKRTTYQTEDSYALYNGNRYSFAIQLDPLSEVIVLWNEQKHVEIGTWDENEHLEVINFIKSELMK